MVPLERYLHEGEDSSAAPRGAHGATTFGLFLAMAVLGFLLVLQFRTQGELEDNLRLRSVDELGRLVGTLSMEVDRLQQEEADLRIQVVGTRFAYQTEEAAAEEDERTLEALGLISGAAPAHGRGVRLEIDDSEKRLSSYELVLVLNELRSAGAEAVALNGRRLDFDSWFGGTRGQLTVYGTSLASPYVFSAVGDPDRLLSALGMPGGLVSMLTQLPGVKADVSKVSDLKMPARPGRRLFAYALQAD